MSPSSREINGSRPPPLKIHKDSHQIQKPPPTRHHPVIIYTHSPKVIHTPACDFMALVQKLTGLSRSPKADEHLPKHEDKSDEKESTEEESAELGFVEGEVLVPEDFLPEIPQFATHPNDQFIYGSPRNLYRS